MKFKRTKFIDASIISVALGLAIVYANFLIHPAEQIFAIINMLAGLVIIGAPIVIKYNEYSRLKQIEDMFPKFLADLAQSLETGMTLPQAIKTSTRNEYGALTQHIHDINAKVSFGISFERILNDFAEKIGSHTMKRTVQTIIETYKSGGTMATVLKSVSESLRELEKIKKERSASIYSQMLNGYLIYLIFLGVMIGLSTFLLPAFQLADSKTASFATSFRDMFRGLIIIQGFFAGMAIGKMSEGRFIAGVKHAAVMIIFGYTAFVIFG